MARSMRIPVIEKDAFSAFSGTVRGPSTSLTPTWTYYPPVIKVPDLSWKLLRFFLYRILEFVYPPMVGRF